MAAFPGRRGGAGRPRPSTRWSVPSTPSDGTVRARVAAVTDRCWQCRTKVRAIVGVLVEPSLTKDGSGFLPLDSVADQLVGASTRRRSPRRGIGRLRHRESPGVEGGYVANGCVECDALLGRFHLEDLLTEHRNAGGSLGQLDIGIASIELPRWPSRAAPHRPGLAASARPSGPAPTPRGALAPKVGTPMPNLSTGPLRSLWNVSHDL